MVPEEASTLVGDRTGLTAEDEVGRRRKKKIDWGEGGKINICEDNTLSAHSEAMTSSAHNDQPRSLNNKINCWSKTTFLSGLSLQTSYHFCEITLSSAHSEAMPSSYHNDQSISLYKYII